MPKKNSIKSLQWFSAIGILDAFPINGTNSKIMNKKLENIKNNIDTILTGIRSGDSKIDSETVENLCPSGQIRTVYMARPLKLNKAGKALYPQGLEKVSAFQIQPGIEYEKKARVIAGRADGSMPKATRPDWAKYVDGSRCLMEHKKDSSRRYLAAGTIDNPSSYLGHFIADADGEVYNYETVSDYLLASEKTKKESRPWTRIALENIIELA